MSDLAELDPGQPIHVSPPDGDASWCGSDGGTLVSWASVTDPADTRFFTCGWCLAAGRSAAHPLPPAARRVPA